ncbi:MULTISPECIES: multidrug efflux SMR transporter [unclassified Leucobacter]|uniref:DMT family transporter n=1 Tax=unclassified Leucobacter TaxID=2621730 RepID=UPI00165DD3EF|nr:MULTISPECIES: multidrug efflux SMR transporter [unclassified Leucobacter]MBC9926527.1 multidrug efflux SMR transporter [Leucobacter sp. cx-169]
MYWLILLISSVLEAVWAIALSESDGFSRPVPTIVFAVAVTLSMIGLGYAMKGIPTSVAYTVWVGVGAALTVTASMLTGSEEPSPLKLVFLAGIIACVIGLKFAPAGKPAAEQAAPESSGQDPARASTPSSDAGA